MTSSGLEALDASLAATDVWLGEVGAGLGQDRQHSFHALLAVLTVLRDCLSARHAAMLAGGLPLVVRGLFYTGYHPENAPLPLRTQEEFVTLVAKRFGNIGPIKPRAASMVVLRVLERRVSANLLAEVKDALQPGIRALFRADSENRQASQPLHADRTHADRPPADREGVSASESPSRDWGSALSGQEEDPHIRPDRLS